jgi:heat shock protein HslJ
MGAGEASTLAYGSLLGKDALMSRCAAVLMVPALVVLLAATGCSAKGGSGGSQDPSAVRDVDWTLEQATGEDVSSFNITANFGEENVGGFGGVNSYTAPCELSDDGSMQVGDVTSTLMAGSDEANAAEAQYFELLKKSAQYQVDGDQLVLLDGDGEEILRYQR